MWHVYIIQCRNDKLYTGMTDDLQRRFKEHLDGNGGRFTKIYGAQKLLYHEEFSNQNGARQREYQLKRWTHRKKMALIEGNKELLKRL